MNSSRPAELDDPAALAALYDNRPIAAVAEHLGVSAATVQRALARHGIPRRGRSETASARINNQLLADRVWLHDRYRSATITAIAAELGVATLTVRRALLIHGIALHRHKLLPRPERPSVLDDRSWLEARYQRAWSIREIADELGVNDQMVGAALRRHRIPIRSDRGAEHPGLTDPVRLATLVEEHGTDGAAAALGVTRVAVQAALRRHGLASPYRYEHRHLERPSQVALLDVWTRENTIKGVARDFGVSHTTAAMWLASVGVYAKETPAISRRELEQCISDGLSVAQISHRHRVTARTVIVELHRHELFDRHRRRHWTDSRIDLHHPDGYPAELSDAVGVDAGATPDLEACPRASSEQLCQ